MWNASESSTPARMVAIDISMSAISGRPARLAASVAMWTERLADVEQIEGARGSRRIVIWKKSPTRALLGAETVGRRPCRMSSNPRASRSGSPRAR